MACRVGITTDPKRRRAEWTSEYPDLMNWEILAGPVSRAEAQEIEDAQALMYGCEASPGGDEPDQPGAEWYVYRFDY
jgi:hypothetical protein